MPHFEEQSKNWKSQRRHPGTLGFVIALRGDVNLVEEQEDSSTRKTISGSMAATIEIRITVARLRLLPQPSTGFELNMICDFWWIHSTQPTKYHSEKPLEQG